MAEAEAKHRQHRTTNPPFVHQENSRTTPKSSHCSSSSSEFETKWWLHPKPTYKHRNNFSQEHLDISMDDFDLLSEKSLDKTVNFGGEIREFCYKDEDMMMGLDPYNCLVFENPKKHSSDLDSQWVGVEKAKPWWRTVDKDELASFVSQESFGFIENCDLPRPQKSDFSKCFDQNNLASLDVADCEEGKSQVSDRSFGKAQHNDLSKAELVEALCHSQTRAREAEKAAKKAYDEKEHIIKLFFRQASQLFAYKQWLQILQLETLCLQLNNNKKDEPIFLGRVPGRFLWVPPRGGRRRGVGSKRKKWGLGRGRRRCVCKCAVVLAVGLGLAGAGLILGWTMGWLFPAL